MLLVLFAEKVQTGSGQKSQNSLENVQFGIQAGLEKGLSFNTVTFLFKTHTAGRGYCTLRKFLPHAKILQRTFSPEYSDTSLPISKPNWYRHQESRNRVWGEIVRLRE